MSEEGTDIEIREEEDDLLRAAEELGIDLSGVRATDKDGKQAAGTPADETEEAEVTEDDLAAEETKAEAEPEPEPVEEE